MASTPVPLRSFTAEKLPVRIYPTPATLAVAAAADAARIIREAVAARGRARVILATGNSQLAFLDALVREPAVAWKQVEVFHMDEYLGMPRTHPASFRRYLQERVADRVPLAAFHGIEGDALEPLRTMQDYAARLTAAPVDLCCLGIGENGHLAFNDPPVADFADPAVIKLARLDEACRRQQVGEGHFPHLDAVPAYAITLTIPALCAAARMIAVVPEARKAAAVQAALEGPVTTACPGSFLRRQAHATLYLEAASAARLSP
ncbi:MAG TPA: glucosamine-6-phosphate deaminase [Opitutaceae bacterium]|nr:glucosamine-6-phosphate deaminase [Opitutaceae bacterium]